MTDSRPELSERAFRRCESVLRTMSSTWPAFVELDPHAEHLMASTLVSRLRDALRSYRMHKWHTDWTPKPESMERCHVLLRNNKVVLGPRMLASKSPVGTPSVRLPEAEPRGTVAMVEVVLVAPDLATVRAYCHLASLRPPGLPRCRIRASALSQDDLTTLDLEYDISIEQQGADVTIT